MKHKKASKNASSDLQLVAQPYAFGAPFWYFGSAEEFDKQYKAHLPVEEYEIDLIDGDDLEALLFKAMQVSQGNVHEYFEKLDEIGGMQEHELAAFHYATDDLGISDIDDAIALAQDEIRVTEGTARDYVYELIEGSGGVEALSENQLEMYFDYEMFGRDIRPDIVDSRIEDARHAARDEDEDAAQEAVEEEYDAISDEQLGLNYVDEVGFKGIGNPETYFDYESYTRDMEMNGEVTEFRFAGKTWATDYR
jgi:antirestriction protein